MDKQKDAGTVPSFQSNVDKVDSVLETVERNIGKCRKQSLQAEETVTGEWRLWLDVCVPAAASDLRLKGVQRRGCSER